MKCLLNKIRTWNKERERKEWEEKLEELKHYIMRILNG